MSSPLLAIHGASKSYNGIPALIDAALDLRPGEVHALMGENGAGKSTLIKLMAGVLSADSMRVEMRGTPVGIHSPQVAFDHGLRFIHQELNVVPQLSVAENIFLGQRYPTMAGILINWRRLNEEARVVLAALGVRHIRPTAQMARLSPGDQMLVNIARAFVGDQRGSSALVYVMDEPTAALSGHEVELLFAVIRRLREQGSAVLYVSHRMDEIFRIANRVTVMRDGRVISTLPISETSPAELIRLMTGRALQQVYPRRETAHGETPCLEVYDLSTNTVRDITFSLREGEILGVAGLIGSGRTELLRALVGVDRVKRGTIALDGVPVGRISPSRAWAAGIAYVPEERRSQGLMLSRSVRDNITLSQLRTLSHGGVFLNHAVEHRMSRHIGASVSLKATGVAQTVRELSGGNQQKVVFARALAKPPNVLLLDEPTRGVDIGAKADLYALIRQISARGTAIVMVSSDLPEVIGMSDRILVMRGGRQVDIVPAEGMTEERLLALCYGEIEHEPASNG